MQPMQVIDAAYLRRFTRRLAVFAILLLIGVVLLISEQALVAFERELLPEYDREAAVVADVLAGQVAQAVEAGVPLEKLVGVEEVFAPALKLGPGLRYAAIVSPAGAIVGGAGDDKAMGELRAALADNKVPVDGGGDAPPVKLTTVQNDASPVTVRGKPVAWVHVGLDLDVVATRMADVRGDIAVVLVVSVLTVLELLAFLIARSIAQPLAAVERLTARVETGDWTTRISASARDEIGALLERFNRVIRRVADSYERLRWKLDELTRINPEAASAMAAVVTNLEGRFRLVAGALRVERAILNQASARAPLFVFIFAEQLSTSFLPLYAKSMATPLFGLALPLVIGLPIVFFVGAIAVATPFGSRMVERWGGRRALAAGALIAILGYIGCAVAWTIPMLIVARIVCAIGYALITIACQAYLAASADEGRRAASMATFVAAVQVGVVCGTAIGAVIAGAIGYAATFIVSALLVGVSLLIALQTMQPMRRRRASDAAPAETSRVAHGWRRALSNPRLAALILFAAIPAKLILTGMLFYLMPLYLAELDLTQAAIGRVMMAYGLGMLATIHLGARIADRWGGMSTIIALAGIVTGLGTLGVLFLEPSLGALVAIIVLGVCQGFASAPMLALLPHLAPVEVELLGHARLLGYLRVAERFGSVVAPITAAMLVAHLRYVDTILVFGAISTATAFGFVVLARAGTRRIGTVPAE
jgi:predicted MFS family arabinose efflux permease/HAMP domain-containing protein